MSIAHDFNNLLAGILSHTEMARLEIGEQHAATQALDEVDRAGQLARDLVKRILIFGRPRQSLSHETAVRPALEESLRLLRAMLPTRISLRLECPDGLPAITADEGQIHQALLNLATNAWQAMEEKAGCIEIVVQPEQIDIASVADAPLLAPGAYVRIAVGDSGKGMDTPTLERIFEPFFTTRAGSTGSGLGLTIVAEIMQSLGGGIKAEGEPGRGSTFHLYFPAAP